MGHIEHYQIFLVIELKTSNYIIRIIFLLQ